MAERTEPTAKADGAPAAPDPAFLLRAKDLATLQSAVVEAAGVGTGLWLSYLFVLLYLAIAAGSVTHQNLFFENPVRLPFLNVDLPLLGFFVLGPAIFLIVHTYVLLHFVLLAGKIGVFHDELQAQIHDDDARGRLRGQLPSNIFVQFLAGPREVRAGVLGVLLRLIAHISLVAAPLALLVLFHLQFLPYHHELIAWWLRGALVIDLVLLWMLWPSVVRGAMTTLSWRDLRRPSVASWAMLSLAPVLLVFTIATFPSEWMDANLPSLRFVPVASSTPDEPNSWGMRSIHELLFGGDIDLVTRKPTSLWSNRLVLPRLDISDRAKGSGEAIAGAFSLRGRHLEGAVLLSAHLSNVDFTAAHLQGAYLNGADLREAKFECAERIKLDDQGPEPTQKFTVRSCAQMQGAKLKGAQMQGSLARSANLEAAMLDGAQMQAASLDGAHLQAASITGASLRGAKLDDAELQGADLRRADLTGASLVYVQLQGANLEGTLRVSADLEGAYVWKTQIERDDTVAVTYYGSLTTGPKYKGLDCPRFKPRTVGASGICRWSPKSFAALKQLIIEQVPSGYDRDQAIERMRHLADDGGADYSEIWEVLTSGVSALASADSNAYIAKRIETVRDIGCDPYGAPSVIRGLIRNYAEDDPPIRLTALAKASRDENACAGARGLSDQDRLTLWRNAAGSR
jgi:uncharacterized protein YjbI with pentapeptide repeats